MPLVLENKIPWENSQFSKKYLSFGPWEKNAQKLLSSVSKKNSKVLVFWSLWKNLKNLCFWSLRKKCPKTIVFCSWKNVKNIWSSGKKILKNHCFLFLKNKIQKYLSFGPCEKNLYWSSNKFFFSKIIVFWSWGKNSQKSVF